LKTSEIPIDFPLKMIAILRGIKPTETELIVKVLIQKGFRSIEIPLNSPNPFKSIEIAVATAEAFLPGKCLVGAGTVLTVQDVKNTHRVGGKLIVSPNSNIEVIRASKALSLQSWPGVMTPTECFSALEAGADGLKIFPASLVGPDGLKAIRAVLPIGCQVYAVGGVDTSNFKEWITAGIDGFGIGSAIYKAGISPEEVGQNAIAIVNAYNNAMK